MIVGPTPSEGAFANVDAGRENDNRFSLQLANALATTLSWSVLLRVRYKRDIFACPKIKIICFYIHGHDELEV